jgi:hypothetical protein
LAADQYDTGGFDRIQTGDGHLPANRFQVLPKDHLQLGRARVLQEESRQEKEKKDPGETFH